MLVQSVADSEKIKTQHNSATTTMAIDIIQIKDTKYHVSYSHLDILGYTYKLIHYFV